MTATDHSRDHRDRLLTALRHLVLAHVASFDARVILFGSWATGDENRVSDIDVAIDTPRALPPGVLARLREAIEESTIPYAVDIVDLRDCDAQFRERVLREGIPWNA